MNSAPSITAPTSAPAPLRVSYKYIPSTNRLWVFNHETGRCIVDLVSEWSTLDANGRPTQDERAEKIREVMARLGTKHVEVVFDDPDPRV